MPVDDLENLSFRERPDRRSGRPPRRSSTVPWLVVAIIAAILFALVVRALLERTAWMAGASPVPEKTHPTPMASPRQDFADVSEYGQRQIPSVYRCVDRAGGVSLQSQPCGPGQRTTRVVSAPPDMEPIRPRQANRSVASSQAGYNTIQYQQEDSRAGRMAACAAARQQRDGTLERIGLKRTYNLLQRLDEMVNEACKGL